MASSAIVVGILGGRQSSPARPLEPRWARVSDAKESKVVLTDEQLEQAEERVLKVLENSHEPYSPLQLIDQLKAQQISEFLARAAIWYLIDRNEVELTWDRRLRRLESRPVGGTSGW